MKTPNKYIISTYGLLAAIVALSTGVSASAQTLLLKYSFDETGTTVANSGTLSGSDLTMTSSTTPTDRHTADGGGVTGLSGDRAFTNGDS